MQFQRGKTQTSINHLISSYYINLPNYTNVEYNNHPIIFRLIRRTRTKFFNGGTLLWDENSSAGKYVRENCKPLQVTILILILDNIDVIL